MIIYVYTNMVNGKQYVGQTQRKDDDRIGEHKRHHNTLVDKAMDRYGVDNFKYEVVDNAETTDELNQLEKMWIRRLNTKVPNGYNQTDGGTATRGYKHTKEAKMKMSVTKHKIATTSGYKNPFLGKHHTEATRAKMKAAWENEDRKKWLAEMTKTHHHNRKVLNETTGEVFNSIKEAAEWADIPATHITRVARGKRKHAGGYAWKYID